MARVNKTRKVAVLGAGLAGLSCAQALLAAGLEVRVFEQFTSVGGRCATRLWQGHLVDYGVQYFTAQSQDFKKELLLRLRQFRPIISPILDVNGQVVTSTIGPRFYVLQGNNYLAQVLSRGLDISLQTTIETVTFSGGRAQVLGESYDAVVSALPGPRTAPVFGLPAVPADYVPCLTALVEYGGSDLARGCYARLMPEGHGIVTASYCENHKAGRIVGHKTVFMVHGAPGFSREHLNNPPEEALAALVREHEKIWGLPSDLRTAASLDRWTFARPENHRTVELPQGAFICGDTRSEPTVEEVWLDGRRAADEVMAYLA
jgi:predicted NAD/FAD-dependent oxidoreductase